MKTSEQERRSAHQLGSWLIHRGLPGARTEDVMASGRWVRAALEGIEKGERELPSDTDPRDLRQTGWGILLPESAENARARALQPLLDRRRHQAGRRFRRLVVEEGITGERFLADLGEHLGTLRLDRVPYYLLIAATPEEISFEFQYHLSLTHAVGRIAFDDLDGYRQYAHRLVDAESRRVRRRKRIVGLFSVENDPATHLLGRHLTTPVQLRVRRDFPHWNLWVCRRSEAHRRRLLSWLRPDGPGLALVSSHGRSLPVGNPEQTRLQGAVVCEPEGEESPAGPSLLSADDVVAEAEVPLDGTLFFLFGCYGAGLPVLDGFPHTADGAWPEGTLRSRPKALALRPFVAALPKELLLRGAGAVVGHIDRGWTTAYLWPAQGPLPVETSESLLDCLALLLRGHRLGHALVPLRRRHAQLGAKLSHLLDVVRAGGEVDLERLGTYWIGVNDARNLIVVGDPAVFVPGRPDPTVSIELGPALYGRLLAQVERQGVTVEEWIEDGLRPSA